MAWTIFQLPNDRRAQLDEALRDEVVARQSHKLRDAATLGGPSGHLFILIDGSVEAVARAETLLQEIGTKLPAKEGEALRTRLQEEDEAASVGMGLFFTE
ncbi:MAG: hypothetical protein L3K14_06700 [Thermoplasmata archaeon]|nr:hypothetical protein [Thermoplasmata archaeon]